jgi:restriction system protein
LAIPDFQTLMLPVLRIAATGEVRISEVVEKLEDEFGLSAEERSHLLPSGKQTTFANRVHWAKSYLGKAGLVELTKRAHFRITDTGRKVLATPPERIDIKFLNRFPSFKKFREDSGEEAENGEGVSSPALDTTRTLTPDEVMREAHRELNGALADELMQRIRSGTPAFFESLVGAFVSGDGLWRFGRQCQQGPRGWHWRRRRRWHYRPRRAWT